MSEKREEIEPGKPEQKSPSTLPQGDVVQQEDAYAPSKNDYKPKSPDCQIPTKKRKTRRGKSKRRYAHNDNNDNK